jgi:hypothetical protein
LDSESGRIELTVSGDKRLVAGVAGAVNHVAEAAGLKESARVELVAAVEDACRAALDEVTNNGNRVQVILDNPPGKIEIVLEYKPTHSAAENTRGDLAMRARVDSVVRESTKNGTRVTLQKKVKR